MQQMSMWQVETSFFACLIFDWRTFSWRVTVRWSYRWAKNQVSTNQNSRNKETPTEVFSLEYCKISKNIFFIVHLRFIENIRLFLKIVDMWWFIMCIFKVTDILCWLDNLGWKNKKVHIFSELYIGPSWN